MLIQDKQSRSLRFNEPWKKIEKKMEKKKTLEKKTEKHKTKWQNVKQIEMCTDNTCNSMVACIVNRFVVDPRTTSNQTLCVCSSPPPDAVAYAALLRNELLGAGIETVPDPHTDDRRHAVLSQDSHNLFRVRGATGKY